MINNATQSRALKWFAILTAATTFLLVWVGGLVTSHGAGLAVPDWPNTFGYNMFFFPFSKWIGGIFYEHSHRLIASGVGMLTMILTLWLHGRNARPLLRWGGAALVAAGAICCLAIPRRLPEDLLLCGLGTVAQVAAFVWPNCDPSPRWLRTLGLVAFGAVVLQGVLGGLRVVELKDQIGIFHATLAQLFFTLVCAIALFQTDFWRRLPVGSEADLAGVRYFFLGATILILAQLVLGATMRHQHAGLAIPDFPAAYGKVWPATDAPSIASYNSSRLEVDAVKPITAAQVVLQMVHRIMALAIFATVALCAWKTVRQFGWSHRLSRVAGGWFLLICAQVCLGAATIWTGKAADVATAHVAVGALSLVTGRLLSIIAFRTLAVRAVQSPVAVFGRAGSSECGDRSPLINGATCRADQSADMPAYSKGRRLRVTGDNHALPANIS